MPSTIPRSCSILSLSFSLNESMSQEHQSESKTSPQIPQSVTLSSLSINFTSFYCYLIRFYLILAELQEPSSSAAAAAAASGPKISQDRPNNATAADIVPLCRQVRIFFCRCIISFFFLKKKVFWIYLNNFGAILG